MATTTSRAVTVAPASVRTRHGSPSSRPWTVVPSKIRPPRASRSAARASRYLTGWNWACPVTFTAPATGNGSPVSVTNDAGSPASSAAAASARSSSTRPGSRTYV